MKVLSYLKGPTDSWIPQEHAEGFVSTSHWRHLGDFEDREYFSFDPEFVTVAEQDEKFAVKVYDPTNKEDKAHLDSLHSKLSFLRQDLVDIKAQLFTETDLFDLIVGLASQDKYIIKKINELKTVYSEHLTSLGF
jgi:hypothetical protein